MHPTAQVFAAVLEPLCASKLSSLFAGRSNCVSHTDEPSWSTPPIQNWRGRDGNDPSVDIAKDADQRF
jgi:hypothetical protein